MHEVQRQISEKCEIRRQKPALLKYEQNYTYEDGTCQLALYV